LDVAVVRQTTEQARSSLFAEAHLAAKALPAPPWQFGPELQALVQRLGQDAGARVTLIGQDGSVLADSRHDPSTMENHADRPERIAGVHDGQGSSVRFSETLGVDMLYVALPVSAGESDGDLHAKPVVRLAMPLTAVRDASAELRRILVAAFVLSVLLVWLLSHELSGALTEPVRRLVHVARRAGRGDLEARVEGIATGDLRELAEVFNDTLARLAELIALTQKQGRHYAAMLEQMTDAVVVVDREQRIQFVNRAFSALFDVDTEGAAGRHLNELVLNYEFTNLLGRAVQQGIPQRHEIRILHPQTRILVAVAASLISDDNETLGAVGLLHDITDLRKADQVRRDFVSNASHELRTPAAGIRALAEALETGAIQDPEKGPQFVHRIIETAERLTNILDDMLTLTRVERGRELLHPQWTDVGGAFAEAIRQIQPAATARSVALASDLFEGDSAYVDPAALQTVLINLLDNAVKYTPAAGEVTLTGRKVPGGYEIAVADTGIGIPSEDLDRIFERFYRVDKARDRATGGTGLGLSIVKHTVEAHGGSVSVESPPGQGSTFRVFSPDASPQPR